MYARKQIDIGYRDLTAALGYCLWPRWSRRRIEADLESLWSTDGDAVVALSVRTAFDLHDTPNAPLRVLPGSHNRPLDEVENELRSNEIANGTPQGADLCCFAPHEREVAVELSPNLSLVWTPSCWHATGVKTAAGPRRAMGWNYFPPEGRKRDLEALKHVFAGQWEGWSEERKRLWGLI